MDNKKSICYGIALLEFIMTIIIYFWLRFKNKGGNSFGDLFYGFFMLTIIGGSIMITVITLFFCLFSWGWIVAIIGLVIYLITASIFIFSAKKEETQEIKEELPL